MEIKKNKPDLKTDILIQKKLQEPPLYQVILWNDDKTTMDFVVKILEMIFHFSYQKAVKVMKHIHEKGSVTCGIFPLEIAETKVWQVRNTARKLGYPLVANIQKICKN